MCAILALAGCGPGLEIAILGDPGRPPSELRVVADKPRNELIVAAVELALAAGGESTDTLKAVVVTRGPGSFTGLRVTLATALGLVHGLGIEGRGYNSLLVQAARTDEPACLAVQPARRGVVWVQRYRRNDELPEPVDDTKLGDARDLTAADVPVVGPEGLSLPADVPLAAVERSTAAALLWLHQRVGSKHSNPLSPLYLEPPTAEAPRRDGRAWPRSLPAT